MKVVFVHRSDTRNVGDLRSSPARYFKIPDVESEVVDIDKPLPRADWYVFGGGGSTKIFADRVYKQISATPTCQ